MASHGPRSSAHDLNWFLALIIPALFVGLGSGMPLREIGSSFQAGVGADLETIADLQRIPELLSARGYQGLDVKRITHGNLIGFLRQASS